MSSRIKLGSVIRIMHGYAFKSENYVAKSKYRLITLGNFAEDNNSFKYNDDKATYYGTDFPRDFILNTGDLIMPLTEQVIGLFGNSAFVPYTDKYTFVLNQRVGKVVCDESKADKYFIHYLLATDSVKKQLEARASGTRQRNISPDDVYDVEVFLPDISTQKRIGAILYNIEQKQENNNDVCADLEGVAKLLYDYWFVQFDFPDENGKPYKSSGGKMVWNDELKREIPDGWNLTTIGDITLCHDSKRVPVANKDRETMKGNIPYYGATGIMGYVNSHIFDGDYVLMAEDGSIMDDKGYPILQRISGKTWVNNHAHVLEPIKGYSCKMLLLMFKDIPVRLIKTGSIQMKINQENMNSYKLIDIPDKLKTKAQAVLDKIDEQQIAIQQENQELASLRDFLLPMLMNGQVTVKKGETQ